MKRIVLIAVVSAVSAASMLAANAKNGNALYDKSCKACHGADGTPNPAISKVMGVELPDFKSFKGSDADIKAAVTAGKGKMKPIAAVQGGDVDDVIAYVHTLKK